MTLDLFLLYGLALIPINMVLWSITAKYHEGQVLLSDLLLGMFLGTLPLVNIVVATVQLISITGIFCEYLYENVEFVKRWWDFLEEITRIKIY